jgi:hypothetical protein
MTTENENSIKASPTKEFFISMLTRDISTDRAILDLIDNSIDAATQSGKDNASVNLTINSETFSISDNAGGLDLEIAKEYAFRFGRSSKNPLPPNSVGQFGVGMKRTLFKIGQEFIVESMKGGIAYQVHVDVGQWLADENNWDFQYSLLKTPTVKEGETRITITRIRDESKDLLGDSTFINTLSQEVSAAYFKKLHGGLKIVINGAQIKSDELTIKISEQLSCIKKQLDLDGVKVTIYCGVSDREWNDGGWYVVCNDRLVAQADQSTTTGWGVSTIPKYHADFAYFRGLVEFSSEDSSKLPWTTTKTGVDEDQKIYKAALYHMSVAMKPVLTFLRELAQETTAFNEGTLKEMPLAASLTSAKSVRILESATMDVFMRPEKLIPADEAKVAHIQYRVPLERYELARAALSVNTMKEVGERTFDYFYTYECKDE